MTTPQPPPTPDNRTAHALRTAVLALVRAYQDGGRPHVQSAETHLQQVTDLPDPDGGTDASDPCMPRSLCRVLSVALIPHAAGRGILRAPTPCGARFVALPRLP
jgi:hypothetical protein